MHPKTEPAEETRMADGRVRHAISEVTAIAIQPGGTQAAREVAATAALWLCNRGVRAAVPLDFARDYPGLMPGACEAIEFENLDAFHLVVALGGDGTLLRAARAVAGSGVPVMGVNLGTLGFLSAYSASQTIPALQDAVDGKLVWESRLRMQVKVKRRGEVSSMQTACNDAYVKHGELPRMLRLVTTVGGHKMAEYRADGLIVSTPMGSTAYNLASGGPIVDAGTDTFTITPICPHSLTHRPVVTPASRTIGIRYTGPGHESSATLSVDGQWSVPLEAGDEISIERAATPLKLVPPHATVFEVLRHKLGWGGTGPA